MTGPSGQKHAALINLPEPYFWLIPELDTIAWPKESLADCTDCVVCPTPEQDPTEERFFRREVRCCGYHPWMPNHLVGRILRDGGKGEELMGQRVATMVGVKPEAVHRRTDCGGLYEWGQELHFGHDVDFRCPYWMGGTDACAVWLHRESVCRTWYCRHVEGVFGGALWHSLRLALAWCDERLARWCVDRGAPPKKDADVSIWLDWYIRCADRMDRVPADEISALADDELGTAREHIRDRDRERSAPRAEVLEPAVEKTEQLENGVRLFGGAPWNYIDVPRSVFAFFALLDGATRWRDALEQLDPAARAEIDEELVEQLVLVGVLRGVESD